DYYCMIWHNNGWLY
nr:immunoglobulin light chain junction region [Macaca mulatta]